MLLIDGARYELWTPKKEVEEFHPIIKEHYKEIFGISSIFLEGNWLQSESGLGSVPDGFVITLDKKPKWYIIEVELSTHPLYDHIVNQVGRFITGIKNTNTQKKIIESIYRFIQANKRLRTEFEEAINSSEIFKYISDLVANTPTLVIIIEQKTPGMDEALNLLNYSPIEVIEFQTFVREGVGLPVHAHLFEPLYKTLPPKPPPPIQPPGPHDEEQIEILIRNPSFIKFHLFSLPKERRSFFPGYKIPFQLVTDIGMIQTYVTSAKEGTQIGDPNAGNYIQSNLADWYKKHPNIKIGDKVIIKAIETMKKYRLEIVK
jgi:hypothetical protein